MIGKRLGSSLPARIKRSFADSVCIMAGYPSMDHVGARIMKGLQAKSTEKLEFFGMGGHKMTEAGLSENLGDVSKLKDKPLYIFNNAHPHHRERLYAIYMIAVRYKNYKVIKQIEKELYDMLFEKEPLAFLTLGNEYFMKRLYLMVDKKFQENHHQKKMKPAMLFYDRFMIGQRYDNLKYLDHFIYHTPYNPLNKLFYDFPSTFTGSQGLFDVYQYLYKQHEQYKRLADDSGVYLSLESNDIVMDNLIMHSRSAFRQKHSIPDSATVFFGSVGSNEQEVKWAGNLFCKGVNMFLDKYSKVSADNFVAILSVPEDLAHLAGQFQSQNLKCRLIVTTDRETRFGAMSASDLAVAVNGDAVTECAGMQLPTLILESMDQWHSYWMLLYNQFNNNINIANRGPIYPELVGQGFPEKIVELWGEWYLDPKKRYQMVNKHKKVLSKFLAVSNNRGDKQIVQSDLNLDMVKFSNPTQVAVDKIWDIVSTFKHRNASLADHHEIAEERAKLVSSINTEMPDRLTAI